MKGRHEITIRSNQLQFMWVYNLRLIQLFGVPLSTFRPHTCVLRITTTLFPSEEGTGILILRTYNSVVLRTRFPYYTSTTANRFMSDGKVGGKWHPSWLTPLETRDSDPISDNFVVFCRL